MLITTDLQRQVNRRWHADWAYRASGAKVHTTNDALALSRHPIACYGLQSWTVVHLV